MNAKVTPEEDAAPQKIALNREKALKRCVCCSIQGSYLAMVAAVSLFVIVLSVVWSVLFFSSITVLADSLRGTTLNRLVDRVTTAIDEMTTYADNVATLLEKGHLDFFNSLNATRTGARDIMLMNKQRNEIINSVIIFKEEGNQVFTCIYQAQIGKYSEAYKTIFTGNLTIQDLYDDDSYSVKSSSTAVPLNPKTGLLGIATAQKSENLGKRYVWSPPHMFVNGPVFASQIVLARPMKDPNTGAYNSLYGLVYTLLRPIVFGKYIAEIMEDTQGFAYIVDAKTGVILATSDPTVPTFNRTITGGYRLLTAYESQHAKLKESSLFLNSTRGVFSTMPSKVQDQYTSHEGTIYLDSFRYNTTSNLDIIFVLLVSQNVLIGNQIAVLIGACLASAFFIIITFLTGCVGSQIILRPLRTLRKQMKQAEDMNLDGINTRYLSYFSEIKSLQHVFYIMVERLVEYRRFLPASVLQALEQMGNDDDGGRKSVEVSRDSPLVVKPNASSRLSISSGRSTATMAHRENKFSIGLNQTELCILSLKVSELQTMVLTSLSSDDYVHHFQKIMDKADSLCRVNRGSLIHFTEDSITFAWPLSRPNSIERAAKVCFALNKFVKELNQKQELDEFSNISIVFSITTGRCHQGNIGGKTGPRIHKTFGIAITKAEALTELANAWKISILVSTSVANALSKHYTFRPIDVIMTVHHPQGRKQVIKTVPNQGNSEVVYELLGSSSIANDEWMYEMNAKQDAEKHSVISKTITSMFAKILTSGESRVDFFTERQAIEGHFKEFPDQQHIMHQYLNFIGSFSKEESRDLSYSTLQFAKTRSAMLYRSLILDEIVAVL